MKFQMRVLTGSVALPLAISVMARLTLIQILNVLLVFDYGYTNRDEIIK